MNDRIDALLGHLKGIEPLMTQGAIGVGAVVGAFNNQPPPDPFTNQPPPDPFRNQPPPDPFTNQPPPDPFTNQPPLGG